MNDLRVAFAGHNRPEDLGDLAEVSAGLDLALDLVGALAQNAVLLTGLADGADRLAAVAWSKAGLESIHAVLPHLAENLPLDITALATATTRLDGARVEADGRNPHLAQTRWLLEDADLLITVWTGEAGRGAGGTADAVRVALRRQIPVIWIEPKNARDLRLILPEALDHDFGFLEFLEQLQRNSEPLVRPATVEALRAAIGESPEAPPPYDTSLSPWERLLDKTLWSTFALYGRLMGGPKPKGGPPTPVPETLEAQPGFRTFTLAYEAADFEARRLAAVHRSLQVFQAMVMILAAAIGSSPAIWPNFEIKAVLTELFLALLTFALWHTSVRSERSLRWGRARRLAEQLRLERAAWALGVSARDERPRPGEGGVALAAWAYRRQIGSPEGSFDPIRVQQWGGWAMDELVDGQIRYHQGQGRMNHRLSHASHTLENAVFLVFVVMLSAFAVAHTFFHHWLPECAGGIVRVAGAVTPAFGAASLALEAALAFAEQSRRSERLAHDLTAVAATVTPDSRLDRFQQAARAAIRIQVKQEDRWSEEAAHRHQVRAG